MQKTEGKLKKVDIQEVFKSKNPKLARILPRFVFNYIRKILHEDFINYFLDKHGDKMGADFAKASIDEFNVEIEIKGEENIPKQGRYFFVANHPLGGFDGVIMIYLLNKFGFKFKVLVNDILMNITNLGVDFVPLNKHGALPREVATVIEEVFASDYQVMTFPSGMVSRRQKGTIKDLAWQKSFILKARSYKRDIVPVHFSGRNSSFFYNLHSFRKFLGIKANLEMFYLMDETYKHRDEKITVCFGKPIPYTFFDKRHKPDVWANLVKEHVYVLPRDVNAEFEG